jgi:membrane fusion protein (multidrug efflux system)
MKRQIWLTLAAFLVVAGGLVGYSQFGELPARAQQPTENRASAAPRAVAVETAPVQVGTVTEDISVVGTAQANEAVTLAPEIEGRIAEILFDEGVAVKKGEPLVRLDDAILKAELTQEQARLTLAQANFQRSDTLLQQRSGTRQARDEAFAELETARAAVELARTRLDKTLIRAPFAGLVGLRSVSPGEYVSPGDALVGLRNIDPLKVDFRAPENYLASVRTGQSVNVSFDALPGQSYTGEIYAIDPQLDVNGRALRLRARISNPDGVLRPGLFARVAIAAQQRANAILVAESALVPEGELRFVYRVRDGKALRTEVTIGQRRTGMVEILSGLNPDDIVVIAGQQRLRDGIAVESVDPKTGV